MRDVIQMLQAYLLRSLSFGECRDWLASVDWNDPALTKEDWETLGELELILTEIGEGLREETEFQETAARIVAVRTDFVIRPASVDGPVVTAGTATTSTSLLRTTISLDSPASQSWNRSLQVAPSS